MKKKILIFAPILISVTLLFVLYTLLQMYNTSTQTTPYNNKDTDSEKSASATTTPTLTLTEPFEDLPSVCFGTPYEDIPDNRIPCDAITKGYYFDGNECAQATLGCYGVFPFSSLDECHKECIRETTDINSLTDPLSEPVLNSDNSDTNTAPALRINGLDRSSSPAGSDVEIQYTIIPDSIIFDLNTIRVMFRGENIVPKTVSEEKLIFTVPTDMSNGSATLFLRAGDLESNTMLFTVSDTTFVVAPKDNEWLVLEDGSKVSKNLVLLFIADNYDLDMVASTAATTEGAEVVGRIDAFRARQLRLPTNTFEELESAIKRLEAMPGIEDVIMDVSMENMTDVLYPY